MSTRMDKYSSISSNESRSSRNKKLYEELYDTMNYTNSVVIDQSKEIDISKIKEIVDKEIEQIKKQQRDNVIGSLILIVIIIVLLIIFVIPNIVNGV